MYNIHFFWMNTILYFSAIKNLKKECPNWDCKILMQSKFLKSDMYSTRTSCRLAEKIWILLSFFPYTECQTETVGLGLRKILILRSACSVTRVVFYAFFVLRRSNFFRKNKNAAKRKAAWEYRRDNMDHHSSNERAQIKKIEVFSTLGGHFSIGHFSYQFVCDFKIDFTIAFSFDGHFSRAVQIHFGWESVNKLQMCGKNTCVSSIFWANDALLHLWAFFRQSTEWPLLVYSRWSFGYS